MPGWGRRNMPRLQCRIMMNNADSAAVSGWSFSGLVCCCVLSKSLVTQWWNENVSEDWRSSRGMSGLLSRLADAGQPPIGTFSCWSIMNLSWLLWKSDLDDFRGTGQWHVSGLNGFKYLCPKDKGSRHVLVRAFSHWYNPCQWQGSMEFLSFHVIPCRSMSFCTIAPFLKSCRPNSEILRIVRTVWAPHRRPLHPLPCPLLVDSGRPGPEKLRRSGKSRSQLGSSCAPLGWHLSRSSPAHSYPKVGHGRSFAIVHNSSFSRDGAKNLGTVRQDDMALLKWRLFSPNSFHPFNDFVLRSLGLKESWLNGPPISGHTLLPRLLGPKPQLIQMYIWYVIQYADGPSPSLLFE